MKRTFVLRDNEIVQRFLHFILREALRDSDKPLTVTVTDKPQTRSIEQSDRYWTTVWNISMATGHSKDEIHAIVEEMALPPTHFEYKGQVLRVHRSTRSMSVREMADMIDAANRLAVELGVPQEIIDGA